MVMLKGAVPGEALIKTALLNSCRSGASLTQEVNKDAADIKSNSLFIIVFMSDSNFN
jgi:hypothetical protein